MKKGAKVLIGIIVVIVITIISFASYVNIALPDAGPPPEVKVEATPELIERGRYLANHVSVCIDCHSTRDWAKFSGPIVPGSEGQGGEAFLEKLGLPGNFYAKNITPAGIGDWTDGEVFRAITCGVSKDGEPLFNIMPFDNFSQMAEVDINAIIAYIRTLKPIENEVAPSEANFPVNLFMRMAPESYEPKKKPHISNTIEYGKYMTTIAGCNHCHTPIDKGEPIKELAYAGGFEFPLPRGGVVRSANITPDKETGIGHWTEEMFVKRFKMYQNPEFMEKELNEGDFNTMMPWIMYSGMKEHDLRAIFRYLRTLKPIKHEVERFTPMQES